MPEADSATGPQPARFRRRLRSRIILSFVLLGFGLTALFAFATNWTRERVEEQLIADLCAEIASTALRRRKFRSEFEDQLRESVKQIFVGTVLQLSHDRLSP